MSSSDLNERVPSRKKSSTINNWTNVIYNSFRKSSNADSDLQHGSSILKVEGDLETEISSLVQMEKKMIEKFKQRQKSKEDRDPREEGGICVICIGSTGKKSIINGWKL